jgi:hypothetical protein
MERVALASSSSSHFDEARRLTDAQATEEAAVELAVQISRNEIERFDWQDNDLETCLIMSLEESFSKRNSAASTERMNRSSTETPSGNSLSEKQDIKSDSTTSSSGLVGKDPNPKPNPNRLESYEAESTLTEVRVRVRVRIRVMIRLNPHTLIL